MLRIAGILVFAVGLAACDAVNTVTEGFSHAKAVESELEQSTGIRPQVGFNSNNGRLVSVTVFFPSLYEGKPLSELAAAVKSSVTTQFKQAPEHIVLSFAVEK
jgi:hypothetical protein